MFANGIEKVLKYLKSSKTKFKIFRFPLEMACVDYELAFQGGYQIHSES